MKTFLLQIGILFTLATVAQSPYLSIELKMDPAKAGRERYAIDMRFCEPIQKTIKGNWFERDTSDINFTTLKPGDITCMKYFSNGEPELISGEAEKIVNGFKFSNQVFAWEKIIIFRISDLSMQEMYVVIPVRYKAFVTHIELNQLAFEPGKIIFLDQLPDHRNGASLSIKKSLEDQKLIDVKNFHWKELLREE